MLLTRQNFLPLLILAIAIQACAALLPLPTSAEKHPFRYDLMKHLQAKSTPKPKPYSSLDVGLVKPVGQFFDMIKNRMALRKKLNPLIDPKLSNFATRIAEGDRTARVQRAFDNVSNFVQLVGDMDSFLTDRARLAVRRLSAMFSEEDRYRREKGQ